MTAAQSPLARYAACDSRTKGRKYPEETPRYRSEYQRDRDRIIHSTAFRRLVYKTQVFVNHEGDLFRTRLTHSIEVAQIARTIARALQLNETLVEAICLAHDLGHTPFGHAGQDALNECMRRLRRLRAQPAVAARRRRAGRALRRVSGLNLTFETREGILKHCSVNNARTLGELGERFIRRRQPTLEAQIANLADEIAYNNHDLDDGLRAGLITLDELKKVPLFRRQYDVVIAAHPGLNGPPAGARNRSPNDQLRGHGSHRNHRGAAAGSCADDVEAVRSAPGALVKFSEAVAAEHLELKRYLRDNVYRHYRVLRMTNKADAVISSLFRTFFQRPELLPSEHQQVAQQMEAN